jgi:hypothetical protein
MEPEFHRGIEKTPRGGPVVADRIVVTGLLPKERSIIIALAASLPRRITAKELIECVYPDPDLEPDWAIGCIHAMIQRIRRRRDLGGWVIKSSSSRPGYWLEKV